MEILVTIEEIIYQNTDNGYTVLDVSTDDMLFSAVGKYLNVDAGDTVTLFGDWVENERYGKQFSVEKCEYTIPSTAADMARYLSSGAIKGIGPKTATKIVEKFGDETFEIIEFHPDRLALIKGISLDKAKTIQEEFKKKFAVREVLMKLEKYGMKPNECVRAYDAYGKDTIEVITENPYILCKESIGISFSRADEIASSFETNDLYYYRCQAGFISLLTSFLYEGHTCYPRNLLAKPLSQMLSIGYDDAEDIITDMIADREVFCAELDGTELVFLPKMYKAEKSTAERLKVMLKFPPPGFNTDIDKDIDETEKRMGISMHEKQKEAIKTAAEKGLLVLTGGPGTGKTTTVNGILELFEAQKLKVVLTAPTGRAAKRMTDITGRDAVTIHRLLEASISERKGVFNRNAQFPLECDAVIVDEVSMVDSNLFWALLDALPLSCRLVLVGDSDQLPAVGAGNVLKDIIESNVIPVVALTEIFRQGQESLIVTNAHKIVHGEMPVLNNTKSDFFFLPTKSIKETLDLVMDLYLRRLPKSYGYDSIKDIQILCPGKKTGLGTVRLNQEIESVINPHSSKANEYSSGGKVFREGDKVMQTKNNYDIDWTDAYNCFDDEIHAGIFNGDIGTIIDISPSTRYMKIRFDDRIANYPFDFVNDLEHAYAVTVHKSQGSEFDCVILPVIRVAYNLAYRNLLYTAITRAKTRIILVGDPQDVATMVSRVEKNTRYSALKALLTQE